MSVNVNPPVVVNVPPTANAGSNQTVNSGAVVTLNGTASTDLDGTIAAYAWTQTAGTPAVTLSSSTASQPTFTAPSVATATTFTFALTVTDNGGATSAASSVNVNVNAPATGNISGRVRFTRIPVTANGLNYAAGALSASRGVLVRAVDAATPTTVLATTSTNANGDYAMNVAANTNIRIVVVSQMLRDSSQPLPRWNFSSADNDATTPTPYTYTDGISFNSSNGTGRNIDIPSGFDAAGNVTGTRASAPFAILDTVYQGYAAGTRRRAHDKLSRADPRLGHQQSGRRDVFRLRCHPDIVLSADVTEDTDEFDQHVIAHEFGHYIEYNFSRADNIGGSHGLGDKLDIRVAFGEGFGYAFGAIVLNDPVARDTFVNNGTRVSSTFQY